MSALKTPFFAITLGDQPLGPEDLRLVESVTLTDEASDKDTATVRLADPDLSFQRRVQKGLSIQVTAGFALGETKTFVGEVSALSPNFPEDGLPTLTVECSSRAKKGHEAQKQKAWKKMKRSDIARQIAQTHGWVADVVPTQTVVEQESQAGESDVDFLQRLARKENYRFRVKGNVMTFRPAAGLKEKEPAATLDYRIGNHLIRSFSPRYGSDLRGKDVVAANVHGREKTVVTATAKESVASPQGKTPTGEANRQRKETVSQQEKDIQRKGVDHGQ